MTQMIDLWPEGVGDPTARLVREGHVRNVTEPTLSIHLPPEGVEPTGQAVVIAPGGAWHMLAIDHEGADVARYLAERGVAAVVLEYRLIETPQDDVDFNATVMRFYTEAGLLKERAVAHQPTLVADGRRALDIVRQYDFEQVGMLGFSAGGYLVASVALDPETKHAPDFIGLVYPAYYGPVVVPAGAPPLFVAVADDDELGPLVLGSVDKLERAWTEADRPLESHHYPDGGHGFGTNPNGKSSEIWLEQFFAWLTGLR